MSIDIAKVSQPTPYADVDMSDRDQVEQHERLAKQKAPRWGDSDILNVT
jgi:hypothetical protein